MRIYRPLAALMALVLLLSGALPLVQHLCARASEHGHAQTEACPYEAHRETREHGAHDHAAMHAPALEAGHAQAPPIARTMTHEAMTPGTCCYVEAAQGVVPHGVRKAVRAMESLAVPVFTALMNPSPQTASLAQGLFFDTGPPPAAPVALHLLLVLLLN